MILKQIQVMLIKALFTYLDMIKIILNIFMKMLDKNNLDLRQKLDPNGLRVPWFPSSRKAS